VGFADGMKGFGGAIHEVAIQSAMHMKIDETWAEGETLEVLVILNGALVEAVWNFGDYAIAEDHMAWFECGVF